jgi:hypothetical protein
LIGVAVRDNEQSIVQEFFELFKTPWEFCKPGESYEVVISTQKETPGVEAKLFILVGTQKTQLDSEIGIAVQSSCQKPKLEVHGRDLPVYGEGLTFSQSSEPFLKVKGSGEAAGTETRVKDKKIIRLGVDLFQEVDFILTHGQPAEHAHIPTLEIYRSMIKEWISEAGISVPEIPPVPHGYDFICCLTHDVDFAGIRHHFFDRTMAGFIYRALVGSIYNVMKGQSPGSNVLKNWGAALKLPGVYLGVAQDFWMEFDRFLELEKGLGGTYFFLPFKNREGCLKSGKPPRIRACKYGLEDVRLEIEKLMGQGCEIGLHGIDAWISPEKGREEYLRISQISSQPEIGVRMHWLYSDPESPRILDQLGFSYDSTAGYNEAVGYRAGTTQVYRPPGVQNMLELPLHIQDTALFYPDRMNLSPQKALRKVEGLIENAEKLGGVLTINWHHRSLGPERLWEDFYAELLGLLKGKKVWFGTARQIVQWFRRRRALSLEEIQGLKSSARMDLDGRLIPSGRESPTRVFRHEGDGLWGKGRGFGSHGVAHG